MTVDLLVGDLTVHRARDGYRLCGYGKAPTPMYDKTLKRQKGDDKMVTCRGCKALMKKGWR